jgi:hypothetical protein
MTSAQLLLHAYYELLHEHLSARRGLLEETALAVLTSQIQTRNFPVFTEDHYAAYKDAALAFIEERLETYNPTGIQYTFGPEQRNHAFELELQLDWFDARSEYQTLLARAGQKAQPDMTEPEIRTLAAELIDELGAYPDKSIIAAYTKEPALNKLPDYAVACAIEQVLRPKEAGAQ